MRRATASSVTCRPAHDIARHQLPDIEGQSANEVLHQESRRTLAHVLRYRRLPQRLQLVINGADGPIGVEADAIQEAHGVTLVMQTAPEQGLLPLRDDSSAWAELAARFLRPENIDSDDHVPCQGQLLLLR